MSHRVRCVLGLSALRGNKPPAITCACSAAVSRGQSSHFLRRLHSSTAESGDRPARIVDVSQLAEKMRASVRAYTEYCNDRITLMGVLAEDGPFRSDAELYSDHIADTCAEDGIDYELCRVPGGHVETAIREANSRSDVHGVLVYYPIFKKRASLESSRGPYKNQLTGVYYKTHDDYLRDLVCHTKDVEGLCHYHNARWLFRARAMRRLDDDEGVLFPCTALSVLRILETYLPAQVTTSWRGTVVTIVNRSEILGRPLAAMLANAGATVYSIDAESILLFRDGGRMRRCTEPSITMEHCIQQSTVVVTGVPLPHFAIPCDYINPCTTVVNVSEYPNVDENVLLEVPGVQFIPQVGKVTIAALEQNLIDLHRRHHNGLEL